MECILLQRKVKLPTVSAEMPPVVTHAHARKFDRRKIALVHDPEMLFQIFPYVGLGSRGLCGVLRIETVTIRTVYAHFRLRARTIKLLDMKITAFAIFLSVAAFFSVAQMAAMLIEGVVHANRYTYWNYTLQTAFYVMLWLGYVTRLSYLVSFSTKFVFPVVFTSNFFVFLVIIIILLLDKGALFLAATNVGGGHENVGVVHTFDQLVHVFPAMFTALLLVVGYVEDVRRTFARANAATVAYMVVAPLAFMAVYGLFFNPTKEYPTSYAVIIPILSTAGCYFLVSLFLIGFVRAKKYGKFSG